ncbi:adenosylcobinamide-GDP ribazoletransferase [Nocardia blacklockiae]|uniref:adenosylcobinamide-GDP ribazoletransferase n=1 Tax=Nocardia blacklockiae TaxID=480036 RepID=UPI001893B8A0|nr:adenosylcobinamide-GDP ribazoletransferase [Nocardia blacklockiae]MBF6174040.1 adenosylcobinamide-GDP ribazoletransferase [Nocardia blacklockiae]
MNGVRLAVSWLTVVPVRGPEVVDRGVARWAIGVAPVVGVGLGLIASGVMWGLSAVGVGFSLAGLLAVGVLALGTRGMHVDGLADTADGLGSYGSAERAREIMKSGGVGPFGVAALIFAIGGQALAFAALAEHGRWFAVVLAVATGRVAVVLACRRGIAAAPGAGFGSLVAGTQPRFVPAAWIAVALAASPLTTADHRWLGPIAVAVALTATWLFVNHCVRRFGGLNGDVLGAAVELTVTVTAVVASLVP